MTASFLLAPDGIQKDCTTEPDTGLPSPSTTVPVAVIRSSVARTVGTPRAMTISRGKQVLFDAIRSSLLLRRRAPRNGGSSYAARIRRDLEAVKAAIATPWSNGALEGHVNRLKVIKRQMYGRAGFELLKARVLPFVETPTLDYPSTKSA